MTIRAKLALALSAITITLLVPLVVALHSLDFVHTANKDLRDREFKATLVLSHTRGATDSVRALETRMLLFHNQPLFEQLSGQVRDLTAKADSLDRFHLVHAAELHGALAQLREMLPREFALANDESQRALADSLSKHETLPAIARVDHALTQAENDLRDRSTQRLNDAEQSSSNARHSAVVALVLAVAIAAAIATYLWRIINRPIGELEQGMSAVADGNFNYKLALSSKRDDEFGALARSFESMAEQLAQLDRLRAEFISIASHELKTPINVITGYLQLVQEGIYGPVTEKQKEVIATTENQARSLARLVHQLLDVSRFEAGGGKLDPRPVDLERFLEELDGQFEVLSMQRGVAFRIERVGDLPRDVIWDRDRMNEVLGNLLSNAFKFTTRGGSVELLVSATDKGVRIDVRDTGAGIHPSQLPHVFEKFYQADNQGAAAHAGTGLGLAIAKQIVVAHQGTIAVESTLGNGTTFTIELPARIAGRPSSPRVNVHAAAGAT